MSTMETNKALMRRFYEEFWCQGNADAADEIIAEELRHDQLPAGWPRGREGFKQVVRLWRRGFPDMHEDVESMIAEGDRVAARFRLTGTHLGEFYGLAQTGRRVDIHGIDLVRIAGGRIAEWTYQEDALALFRQLGAWPADLSGIAGSAS